MEYELAKQLKDKKFPHKKGTEELCESFCEDYFQNIPLEDLIFACGNDFRKLMFHHLKPLKESHIAKYGKDVVWSAHSNRHYTDKKYKPTWGKTPQEAVAKLWINLI